MPALNFILLHVESPAHSATFYAQLFGHPPIESSPTFAMFKLETGLMLGLWSRHTVDPAATVVGGSELAFALPDDAAVDQLHAQWQQRGVEVIQAPTRMDFGYTFTAVDPDGHRLRAFAPAAE